MTAVRRRHVAAAATVLCAGFLIGTQGATFGSWSDTYTINASGGAGTWGPTYQPPDGCSVIDTSQPHGGYNLVEGTDGHDVLFGTRKPDLVLGHGGHDLIKGLGGDDCLVGGGGDDLILGFDGNDVLLGGEGNDGLLGGDGEDRLDGGTGNDLLSGGHHDDQLHGGPGLDLLLGGFGDDSLDGGTEHDICIGGFGSDDFANCEGSLMPLGRSAPMMGLRSTGPAPGPALPPGIGPNHHTDLLLADPDVAAYAAGTLDDDGDEETGHTAPVEPTESSPTPQDPTEPARDEAEPSRTQEAPSTPKATEAPAPPPPTTPTSAPAPPPVDDPPTTEDEPPSQGDDIQDWIDEAESEPPATKLGEDTP